MLDHGSDNSKLHIYEGQRSSFVGNIAKFSQNDDTASESMFYRIVSCK